MRRAYKTLLRLYPWDFRASFADEMSRAFEASGHEHSLGSVITELIALATRAAAEWIAKLTTSRSVRDRCLPDIRMMRPPGVPRELWFARAGSDLCSSDMLR